MRDLTTGSVSRHLLDTASFMLVTMVFQTLYFLVDLYWVGRLGKEAVAGVAVAGNLTFLVLALSQMLGVGTTALVSHAAGRKDQREARLVFNQAQVISLLVAGAFFVAAMGLRRTYAGQLSADDRTADLAVSYLTWFVPAMALQFGIVAMGAALRGTGNFKPGMVVQTTTVVVNMVVAPILIFGWGTGRPLGVAGAAIASLVAVVIGTAWLATYFTHSAYLHFSREDWWPRPDLWRRLLAVGLPAGAEFALMAVYLVVVYTIAKPFGAAAQAGFGIAMRVVQAGFMPVVAIGFAVAPVAGQNFGARRLDRVRRTFRSAAGMAAAIMLLFAVACQIGGAGAVSIFTDDATVIAVGAEYLRIVAWSFVASGLAFVTSSTFQALGHTLPPLFASALRLLLVVVPALALARRPDFELRWLWWVSTASIWVQVALALALLWREPRFRHVAAQPHQAGT
jgi:putative MATE family efflux protein